MNTIRWGMLGCGDVTEVKSGPGFQKAAGGQLVAVMRRNGALAADYARRHGVPRWYDDADALIADPVVDAVYIATPPSSHKALALRCAAAGKPCYIEKPMALTHAESLAIVAAFEAARVPLFVAYYRRAMARFVRIRELVHSGALGRVHYASLALHRPADPADSDPATAAWRVDPAIAGGGRFVDMGSHQLDFLDALFGPIREVAGFSSRSQAGLQVEDTVVASLRHDNGTLVAAAWNFAAADTLDRCELVGEHGRLVFSTFDDAPFELITAAGCERFDFPNPPHVQQPLIQNVTDCLLGRAEPLSTGTSAARTDAVIDRILARA